MVQEAERTVGALGSYDSPRLVCTVIDLFLTPSILYRATEIMELKL
jgi:hypothetical protein